MKTDKTSCRMNGAPDRHRPLGCRRAGSLLAALALAAVTSGCVIHEHYHRRPPPPPGVYLQVPAPAVHVHGAGCGHVFRGGVWITIP